MYACAERLATRLGCSVLLKGGHLQGDPIDVLYHEGQLREWRLRWRPLELTAERTSASTNCEWPVSARTARTTSATSDLDIIVIYDADGEEASEGRRPLAARTYYARLTQAMVTALSAAIVPMSTCT